MPGGIENFPSLGGDMCKGPVAGKAGEVTRTLACDEGEARLVTATEDHTAPRI